MNTTDHYSSYDHYQYHQLHYLAFTVAVVLSWTNDANGIPWSRRETDPSMCVPVGVRFDTTNKDVTRHNWTQD